ncbi:MAG: deaminase [Proteocatella sp.]
MRREKNNYYLDIAEATASRGTCLRRNYGCIIVKNDEIIATGYTGAPRGRQNCTDINFCYREKIQVPRGQMYEKCRSVHAEMNAIISAPRKDMIGAFMYIVGKNYVDGNLVENANSCSICKRLIINSGISKVFVRDTQDQYREIQVNEWIENDDSLFEDINSGY